MDDAWAVALKVGLPVVIKPQDGNQGRERDGEHHHRAPRPWAFATSRKLQRRGDGRAFCPATRVCWWWATSWWRPRRRPPQVLGDSQPTASAGWWTSSARPCHAAAASTALVRSGWTVSPLPAFSIHPPFFLPFHLLSTPFFHSLSIHLWEFIHPGEQAALRWAAPPDLSTWRPSFGRRRNQSGVPRPPPPLWSVYVSRQVRWPRAWCASGTGSRPPLPLGLLPPGAYAVTSTDGVCVDGCAVD